jgi:hypothetical protein
MFYKIILSLSSIIVTLIIVEISFSFLDIYTPRPTNIIRENIDKKSNNFVIDKDVGWKMAPNTKFRWITEKRRIMYQSNERGFRVSKNSGSLQKHGSRKLLILGDSHIWGLGIEYNKTLAGILSRSTEKLDVVNLAMPGFGLDQMYLSLVHWGLNENPDFVIAGIFTDDFFRSFTNHTVFFNKPVFKDLNGRLVLKSPGDRPGAIYRYLEKKSRILELYRDGEEWLGRNYGVGVWWNLNKLILDKIVQTCKTNNIPLLAVHIPYYTGNKFPVLKRYFDEKNIEYIDLNEMAKGNLQSYYFKKDKHLNESSHKLLAKYANKWIKNNRDKSKNNKISPNYQ